MRLIKWEMENVTITGIKCESDHETCMALLRTHTYNGQECKAQIIEIDFVDNEALGNFLKKLNFEQQYCAKGELHIFNDNSLSFICHQWEEMPCEH